MEVFLLYKQKTAYEMRISDWSSDVCSSDLYRDVGDGVAAFAEALRRLLPAGATIAVDEITGAMHRDRAALLPDWPPRAASQVISAARLVKTVDALSCLRHAMWSTEQAMAQVHAGLRPAPRQPDLTATPLHPAFEPGADAPAHHTHRPTTPTQ